MLELTVPEMTCAHCRSAISQAIDEIDSGANLHFDMQKKTVSLTTSASADDIRSAIEGAGYAVSYVLQESDSTSCCGSCSV